MILYTPSIDRLSLFSTKRLRFPLRMDMKTRESKLGVYISYTEQVNDPLMLSSFDCLPGKHRHVISTSYECRSKQINPPRGLTRSLKSFTFHNPMNITWTDNLKPIAFWSHQNRHRRSTENAHGIAYRRASSYPAHSASLGYTK